MHRTEQSCSSANPLCAPLHCLPHAQLAPRPPTEQRPPQHTQLHHSMQFFHSQRTKTTPALATPAAHSRDLSSGERERLNPLGSWCPQRPLPISTDHWRCACTQGSELTGSTPALPWYGAWQTACHPVKPGCTHAACTGTARGRTPDVRCTKPTQHQFALEQKSCSETLSLNLSTAEQDLLLSSTFFSPRSLLCSVKRL